MLVDLSNAFLISIPSIAHNEAAIIPQSIPTNLNTLNSAPSKTDGSNINKSPETIERATPAHTFAFWRSLKINLKSINEKIGYRVVKTGPKLDPANVKLNT